jgi:hypothetical protein
MSWKTDSPTWPQSHLQCHASSWPRAVFFTLPGPVIVRDPTLVPVRSTLRGLTRIVPDLLAAGFALAYLSWVFALWFGHATHRAASHLQRRILLLDGREYCVLNAHPAPADAIHEQALLDPKERTQLVVGEELPSKLNLVAAVLARLGTGPKVRELLIGDGPAPRAASLVDPVAVPVRGVPDHLDDFPHAQPGPWRVLTASCVWCGSFPAVTTRRAPAHVLQPTNPPLLALRALPCPATIPCRALCVQALDQAANPKNVSRFVWPSNVEHCCTLCRSRSPSLPTLPTRDHHPEWR